MVYAILFVFGAIIGSFLNVVALRWNTGITLSGRSFCPSCGKQLKWWELVPVFSFIFLRGRCSVCGTRISYQYPAIEVWTGVVFATLFYMFDLDYTFDSIVAFILTLAVFCIYTVIIIYDLRHKIIPDPLVYTSIMLAIGVRYLLGGDTLDWLAGPILFIFFGSIWLLSRGRAMGFGDAKLGASVGFLLGSAMGFSAIILAFWIGAFVALSYMVMNKFGFLKGGKLLTMKSEVPFAPFIIIGAYASLLLNLDLLHVALF